jgi:hypothetical protein
MTDIHVELLHPALGEKVTGLDLTRDLSEELFSAVHAA